MSDGGSNPWFAETWAWLRRAPLPVVLVISLTGIGGSIWYTRSAIAEVKAADAVAHPQAAAAKEQAAVAVATAQAAQASVADVHEQLSEVRKQLEAVLLALGRIEGRLHDQQTKPKPPGK
jgi:chemotaxis response regulator CheB